MTTQMPACKWRLSSWLLHQPLRIFAATNKQKGDKTMLVIIAKCFRATLATAMTPAISMETAVQDNRYKIMTVLVATVSQERSQPIITRNRDFFS